MRNSVDMVTAICKNQSSNPRYHFYSS